MPTTLPATTATVVRPLRQALRALPSLHPAALVRTWRRIASRYRQRRALADLDDHLLDDVGLTREDAEQECRKPPWR